MAEFRASAAKLGATSVRVIATSAARDARNAVELIDAVRQTAGLETEILSGDKEAEWVFRGVTSNPGLAQSPVLILDVGGGSTEFIVGDNAVPQFRSSYSLGTVRLLEQLRLPTRPACRRWTECRAWLKDFCQDKSCPCIKPALGPAAAPGALGRHRRHRHHPGPHRDPDGRF